MRRRAEMTARTPFRGAPAGLHDASVSETVKAGGTGAPITVDYGDDYGAITVTVTETLVLELR